MPIVKTSIIKSGETVIRGDLRPAAKDDSTFPLFRYILVTFGILKKNFAIAVCFDFKICGQFIASISFASGRDRIEQRLKNRQVIDGHRGRCSRRHYGCDNRRLNDPCLAFLCSGKCGHGG